MAIRVSNQLSRGVVIVGVSCVAGKLRIINVEFSTLNDLSEDRTIPFALSSGIRKIKLVVSYLTSYALTWWENLSDLDNQRKLGTT